MTETPKGWALCTIADALEFTIGGVWGAPPGDAQVDVDVLRVTEMKSFGRLAPETAARRSVTLSQLRSRSLQTGDLLLEKSGGGPNTPVGRVGMVTRIDRPAVCSNFMQLIRPNREVVTPHFLLWQLVNAHLSGVTASLQTATTNIRNLKMKDYWEVPFGCPPLAEQERIVTAIEEAFSKLDVGEAALHVVRQLLKRMRAAILDAAVTGRLVPQDATDTPATKLLAELAIAPIGSSEELPDGWATVALGDLAEVISGPAFKSAQFRGPGEGTRLLRGENIEPGSLRWRDTKTWPDALLAGNEHLLVSVTDLILAMDRPIISTGLKLAAVRLSDLPALLVQRVARIRPLSEELRPFLLIAMQHGRFASHLLGGQVGTQLPHITLKGIRDYATGVPGVEEMERIVTEVDRHMSFVEACHRSVEVGLAQSGALRRSVLKAAFEGRLVAQDPTDEPAAALLERIRHERAAAPKAKSRRAGAKA